MPTRKKSASPKVVKKVKEVVEDVVEAVVETFTPTHNAVEATTPDEVINEASEPTVSVTVADSESEAAIEEISEKAWNKVRGEGDAKWAETQPAFKSNLLYHAEAVRRTAQVLEGDSALAKFEQEVYRQLTGG